MACHRKTLAEGGGGGERQGRSRDTQTPQGMVGRSRDAFRDIQTPWGMVHWGATRDFSYPERNGVMVHSKIFRPRREWCNDAILRPRREDGRYQRFLRPRKEWCSGVFKDTQTRRNWCNDAAAASASASAAAAAAAGCLRRGLPLPPPWAAHGGGASDVAPPPLARACAKGREGWEERKRRGKEKKGQLPLPSPCRHRRRGIGVTPPPRRRGAAAPDCGGVSARRRGAAARDATELRELRGHGACLYKQQKTTQAQRDTKAGIEQATSRLKYRPDTTARQGSRYFQGEFQVLKATCAQKQEREVN